MPKVGVKDSLEASAATRRALCPHLLLQPALHDAVAVQHQLDALQRGSRSSSVQVLAESKSTWLQQEAKHWLSMVLSLYPSTS